MNEGSFVDFLREVLPRFGLDLAGFRNVRSTVKKRLRKRLAELRLADLDAYRAYLTAHAEEWAVLDGMCRIPISRLYRDAFVYDVVAHELLPERAREAKAASRNALRVWSAGCASGEEPYTISAIWRFEVEKAFPDLALEIVATDVDVEMCARARRATYDTTSLREVPAAWRDRAFVPDGDDWRAIHEIRERVNVVREDLRTSYRPGPFDLIFCRNVAFTYFDEPVRRHVTERFAERLHPGGYLVVGKGEVIPETTTAFTSVAPCIYRRSPNGGEQNDESGRA
ncbi:Chemotaxis protein methyltransferase CheR [Labilithrix luteola]|uniref:Chemotaxis protein methyltransferase CheR n=1 Tax=Labilithrix luteola TaxID=1391654 RepID=A0A0K1PJD3_9BACT|nr:protein-glutamate O-methyltransferase CheR [Labilithrix luteola]AKU93516.1 Chemotaxis protein methyltransferase CheR [Labilithrix luteola]